MKTNNGISIKEGRTNKQYINTNYDFIDALNDYADCETLGFYISFKRYINRKNNTKENQITYTQNYLQKQFNIGKTKYYRHLKTLFNIGLCDIEKIVNVKFFVNYNLEDKKNPLIEKSLVYFSTVDNTDIGLKDNIENLINENYPEIPKELIQIVEVRLNTSYIFHDYPPIDILESNNSKFASYRDWEISMNRFSSSKNEDKSDDIASSQNRKTPSAQNEKTPSSQNVNLNNIIELKNNIIRSSNSIINQSRDEKNKQENTAKEIDKTIKERDFVSYEGLIHKLRLEKELFEYPISEWIDPFKKAIWEMYKYDYTKIKGESLAKIDIIHKLQNLEMDMVISTIEMVIEKSKEKKIKYPIAFLKTTLFNEIDEFSAKIQTQLNYDFLVEKTIHKSMTLDLK